MPLPTSRGLYWARNKTTKSATYVAAVSGTFPFLKVLFLPPYNGKECKPQPYLSNVEFGPKIEEPAKTEYES